MNSNEARIKGDALAKEFVGKTVRDARMELGWKTSELVLEFTDGTSYAFGKTGFRQVKGT